MNTVKAFFILTAVSLAGDILSYSVRGILPGSVLGMLLLFLLLSGKKIEIESVRETSLFLVANLSLFILPAALSVITVSGISEKDIILLVSVCAVSTVITLAVTALVIEYLLKLFGEYEID